MYQKDYQMDNIIPICGYTVQYFLRRKSSHILNGLPEVGFYNSNVGRKPCHLATCFVNTSELMSIVYVIVLPTHNA